MNEEQKKLKARFLEPETRGETFVSAELKSAWKVMLDILEVFIVICDKHKLKWWLEGGSMLGAVRHKGFIPWDDDLDVAMPRSDYEKFQKIAAKELPADIFMQTTATDIEYYPELIRLHNSKTCGIDLYHVKRHCRFNMGLFIDVHPIDVWEDNGLKRKIRFRYAKFWRGVISNSIGKRREKLSDEIRHIAGKILVKILGGRVIYWFRDRQFRVAKPRADGKCAILPAHYGWDEKTYINAAWFEKTIDVDFEYLTAKIPSGYEKRLDVMYGDWKTPRRGGAFHGNLIIDANRSYKEILKERYGYTDADLKKCKD